MTAAPDAPAHHRLPGVDGSRARTLRAGGIPAHAVTSRPRRRRLDPPRRELRRGRRRQSPAAGIGSRIAGPRNGSPGARRLRFPPDGGRPASRRPVKRATSTRGGGNVPVDHRRQRIVPPSPGSLARRRRHRPRRALRTGLHGDRTAVGQRVTASDGRRSHALSVWRAVSWPALRPPARSLRAMAAVASPVSTSPSRCRRSQRRPRAASTEQSPAACASSIAPKVRSWCGTGTSTTWVQVNIRKQPVCGAALVGSGPWSAGSAARSRPSSPPASRPAPGDAGRRGSADTVRTSRDRPARRSSPGGAGGACAR